MAIYRPVNRPILGSDLIACATNLVASKKMQPRYEVPFGVCSPPSSALAAME